MSINVRKYSPVNVNQGILSIAMITDDILIEHLIFFSLYASSANTYRTLLIVNTWLIYHKRVL